jgi:hypothetical protein
MINGQSGTCGVEFGGWTGGGGATANGWTHFPGNRLGLWKASVNYLGKAAFGGTVNLTSGSFDVLLTNGAAVIGTVTGGTVTWPVEGGNSGCGVDIAKVSVSVTFSRGVMGPGSFQGCLHDLPAGSVIPPKIWGQLTF